MAIEIHTLKQRVQEFIVEEMMKEQAKMQDESDIIDAHSLLMFGEGNFADRLEAVANDILSGNHISQTEPTDPGKFRAPSDNGDEEGDF